MTDVRGPDGRIVRFPDGTDQGTIMRVMGEIYSGQQPTDGQQGLQGSVSDTKPAEGTIGSAVRAAANGITAGWADKIAAAADTVLPLDSGSQSGWVHGFSDAYAHNRQMQQAQTQADEAAHPTASLLGNVAGAIASPLNKIAAPVEGAGMLANAGRLALGGAAYGGAYGAGQSTAQDWSGEGTDALKGAAGGAAGNLIGAGVGKALGGVVSGVTDPVKRALAARGVQFTPGQAIGGWVEGLEKKLTSLPFTGSQITQRLADSEGTWNSATMDRALEGIGAKLPDGMAGQDAFRYGQQEFDKAFSAARSGLQVTKTPEFDQALNELTDTAANGGVDALAPEYLKRFGNVVDNTVLRKFNTDGTMAANDYTKVVSDLRAAARKQLQGNNPGDAQEYGAALNKLADVLDEAALSNPASDPAAVAQLAQARKAYGLWAMAEDAADRGGAGTAGRFTPTQYLGAVEKRDQSARNRAFSAGNAFDQQWGQNALNALGPRVPNSFTADRVLAAKMAGEAIPAGISMMAGAHAVTPYALALPAADLAGAALYSKPVNAFANKLMFGGGAARAQVGQKLNALAPRIGNAATGAVLGIQHATP